MTDKYAGFALAIVAGAVGIILLAIFVTPARASAILSGLALIAAVVLGYSGYRTATAQATAAARATYLANRPLLVPLHSPSSQVDLVDSAAPDGSIDASYPAQRPYRLATPASYDHGFRVYFEHRDASRGYAQLAIHNIGVGPGIITKIRTWSLGGISGESDVARAVGAGMVETVLVAVAASSVPAVEVTALNWDIDSDIVEAWRGGPSDRVFFIEIAYRDTVSRHGSYEVFAWFDPHGWGSLNVLAHRRTDGDAN